MKRFAIIKDFDYDLDYIEREVFEKTGLDLASEDGINDIDEILMFIVKNFEMTNYTRIINACVSPINIQAVPLVEKSLNLLDYNVNKMNSDFDDFFKELGRNENSLESFLYFRKLNEDMLFKFIECYGETDNKIKWLKDIEGMRDETINRYLKFGRREKTYFRALKSVIGSISKDEYSMLREATKILSSEEFDKLYRDQLMTKEKIDFLAENDLEVIKILNKTIVEMKKLEIYGKDKYKYIFKAIGQYETAGNASLLEPKYENIINILCNELEKNNIDFLSKVRKMAAKASNPNDVFGKYIDGYEDNDIEKLKVYNSIPNNIKSFNYNKGKPLLRNAEKFWKYLKQYYTLNDYNWQNYMEIILLLDMDDEFVKSYEILKKYEAEDFKAYIAMLKNRELLEKFNLLLQRYTKDNETNEVFPQIKVKLVRGERKEDLIHENGEENECWDEDYFKNFYKKDILMAAFYSLKYIIASRKRKDNNEAEKPIFNMVNNNNVFKSPIELEVNKNSHVEFAEKLQSLILTSFDVFPWKKDDRRKNIISPQFIIKLCETGKKVDLESCFLVEKTMGINLVVALTELLENEDINNKKLQKIIESLFIIPNLSGRIFLIEFLYKSEMINKKNLTEESIEKIHFALNLGIDKNKEQYELMIKVLIYFLNRLYKTKEQMVKALQESIESFYDMEFIQEKHRCYILNKLANKGNNKVKENLVAIYKIGNKL